MAYEFFYWPEIQGRGEFVRLALEDAGADYIDVARGSERDGLGVPAMLALMRGEGTSHIPFAPPFLRDGSVIVSHTAAILLYLGGRIGLAPSDEDGRMWAHQLQLTITDIVKEVYDAHHPIDEDKWFHEQKDEAIARAAVFRKDRMPKFLGWFERVLTANPAGSHHLVGDAVTYADLSLFQLAEGLRYAFPRASKRTLAKLPRVSALHQAVTERPRLKAYLASERRVAFNETGIFRHYPELDG
ncbi:MAG TPA: glutathione S-transferase family protein [Acetobacteraceae bacterium]|nr:glutathione S-transferase family protein [Acetobacteraceae bacterium]